MEVIRHPVILDDTVVLGLVCRHNTIGVVESALRQLDGLTAPFIGGAFGLPDFSGYPQPHTAIDTTLAATVMLAVFVQDHS